MKEDYKAVAKELGVRYLFGRWGISWFPKAPGGRTSGVVRIIPLDGWITDPKEILREMRERGFEL